jgi:transcriptional regulator with XRE-family HTH domain
VYDRDGKEENHMDQIKIGRFIAERRKEKDLTQAQLAERLNITDRAISKWETGRSLPDSAIMLELCAILGITVHELLCGERISMETNNGKLEET